MVNLYLGWWDQIIAWHQSKGTAVLTITTEFGPPPYMPVLSYIREPVENQWHLNLYMLRLLKETFTN